MVEVSTLSVPALPVASRDRVQHLLETARETLDMDVAFVTSLDGTEQTFTQLAGDAASFGWETGTRISEMDGYCHYVLGGELPNAVPDARHHPVASLTPATSGADIGSYVGVCQLAWALITMQDLRGRSHDWLRAQRLVLSAARRQGDQWWIGAAHFGIARGLMVLEVWAESLRHGRESVRVFRELGDRGRLADALVVEAAVHEDLHDSAAAEAGRLEAITLYRELGELTGEASVHNNRGYTMLREGRDEEAVASLVMSRNLYRRARHAFGEAMATANLAQARIKLRDDMGAITDYQQAAAIFGEIRQLVNQLECLAELEACLRHVGRDDEARAAWQEASRLLLDTDPDDPMVKRLATRLRAAAS